ncbi:MAG: AarF/ABC1/UbiB kinase family protein [Leptolyngbyaceae cyanobacterium RU_5_1]|nr:AarF/ABC1/UbiB kinase family protein [Leptolyngbyaceae cyanobacterium RU_5_1]
MLKVTPRSLRWQRTQSSLLVRQVEIFGAVVHLIGALWWDSAIAHRSPLYRNRRAQRLVRTVLNLGPTFIKLGQALSTRTDLLPLDYVQALGQLQDRVPEFRVDEAIAIIESELGASLYALYRRFDLVPIAAASLGQVHRARLHSGEEVIVKIQRPGLNRLFELDLKILRQLVRLCDRGLPWTRRYELEAIYQEFAQTLYAEIDYIQEAINADRFRYNFRRHPRIIVPRVYPKYTTKRVLTMDYVPGIKISDLQSMETCGIDVKAITQLGICCYLKQLLQDGFFQADPHPGNLAVSQDGGLIFYDFGMMAEVQPINKDLMVRTFFAVLRKDTEQVIETLTEMGLIEPAADIAPVRRITRFLLEQFIEKPVEVQAFQQLQNELYALSAQHPFRLPAKMTFVLKALTTLDGVARGLDPQYNLLTSAKPFVKSLVVSTGQGSTIRELARQARAYLVDKLRLPNPTEQRIQHLEAQLEQSDVQARVRVIERDRALKSRSLAIRSLVYTYWTGLTLWAGVTLLTGAYLNWAIAAFVVSGLGAIALLRSLIQLTLQDRFNRRI